MNVYKNMISFNKRIHNTYYTVTENGMVRWCSLDKKYNEVK